MLLGIDATVGTWDKENERQSMVRGKMEGYGTVGARHEARARDVQGIGAAKQLRRGGQRQGGNSTKRGVWVDPAADQLGNIAELDPGAFAFGRL